MEADADLSASTLATWARGEAEMPMTAWRAMISTGALPLAILSRMLPDGVELVRSAAAGVDHDDLAEAAGAYLRVHTSATHPVSEAGREIGRGEAMELGAAAAGMRAVAGGG